MKTVFPALDRQDRAVFESHLGAVRTVLTDRRQRIGFLRTERDEQRQETLLWQMFRHGELTYRGFYINLETGRMNPVPIGNTC